MTVHVLQALYRPLSGLVPFTMRVAVSGSHHRQEVHAQGTNLELPGLLSTHCTTWRLRCMAKLPSLWLPDRPAGADRTADVQSLLQEVAQLARESGPRGFFRGLQGAAAFTDIGAAYLQNLLAGRPEPPQVQQPTEPQPNDTHKPNTGQTWKWALPTCRGCWLGARNPPR